MSGPILVDETTPLPPIEKVVAPHMIFVSTKIRWYRGLGYSCSDVSKLLGVKYQQVRNVTVTEPKRGAREEVPPLQITEVLP